MNKAFKYRIYPNRSQENLLLQICGNNRKVWNWFLDSNMQAYDQGGIFIWKFQMANQLPALKEAMPFLRLSPSQSLQQVCIDLDRALSRKGQRKDKGFPKFKGRGCRDSFSIPQTAKSHPNPHIQITDSKIKIPKVGWVRWKYQRPVEGDIKSITVSRDNDRWFVSVMVSVDDPESVIIDSSRVVGIDLGMQTFAALSDGTKINKPNHFKEKERKLKRYQRRYSRKQKGSNNQKKARSRLAKCHQSIRNQRHDFLHKESRKIVDKFDAICMESLTIKEAMMCRPEYQGAAMNRKQADLGWGIFTTMLRYKAEMQGKVFIHIDKWAKSTQTCSCCDHVYGKIMPGIDEWVCPKCETTHDRDLNAALNIKRWGLAMIPHHLLFHVPQVLRDFTPVEITSSTSGSDQMQLGSMKQEAMSFRA